MVILTDGVLSRTAIRGRPNQFLLVCERFTHHMVEGRIFMFSAGAKHDNDLVLSTRRQPILLFSETTGSGKTPSVGNSKRGFLVFSSWKHGD